MNHQSSDGTRAFERHGAPTEAAPFLFTCEHASNTLPRGFSATAEDEKLLLDHWGWDIGARDLTLALRELLGGQAVLSRFSRLVADPNRAPTDPAYIVRHIDGHDISFNKDIVANERAKRVAALSEPYHAAIDTAIKERLTSDRSVQLVSVHSFTPLYLGRVRPMEIGVLFDDFDEHAWRLESALDEQGFEAALNAPYSGKPPDRLIYAAHRHGRAHGIEYVELEVRQDLIETPTKARAVAERIAAALPAFTPPTRRV